MSYADTGKLTQFERQEITSLIMHDLQTQKEMIDKRKGVNTV